jgi:hypothetical protein
MISDSYPAANLLFGKSLSVRPAIAAATTLNEVRGD